MKPETIAKLHHINQEFYQTFAHSFASTRRRIQPGIRKVLKDIPGHGSWLDIGCGSGALAAEWIRAGRTGLYHGIDFSLNLIAEAGNEVLGVPQPDDLELQLSFADLTRADWNAPLLNTAWDGALCFAVLHHIPGSDLRQRICASIAEMLGENKKLYLSVWQIKNSPKLMQRIQSWSEVDLKGGDLEEGDVLMDWRAESRGDKPLKGLRYVHVFTETELSALAEGSGFRVLKSFYSDGKEGGLGLYQTWDVK